jgi:2-methylcitrate dehydratase PrpD
VKLTGWSVWLKIGEVQEESTIAAFGGRVPAPNAAFVNGILCVRLDFDDTQVKGLKIHVSRA